MDMLDMVILVGGEPGVAEAFNYFFSLMATMMIVLFVPIACLKVIWTAGQR